MEEKLGYVYIATNKRDTVLYTGVTSNLLDRSSKHKNKFYKNSFTEKYNVDKLVYYEIYANVADTITREKQIKAGSRNKKIELINKMNPEWKDLSMDL